MKNQTKFAKKSLGQNFLTNLGVRDKILQEAGDLSGKNVLEIGPGLGFLTEALLDSGALVTAIEFDQRAAKILRNKWGDLDNFQLIEGNFLEEDLDLLFEQKNYSIIANIPYNITNPILRKILERTKNKPKFAILMVQKEVAEKICKPQENSKSEVQNSKSIDPIKSTNTQTSKILAIPLQGAPAIRDSALDNRQSPRRSILSIAVEIYANARYCFMVPRTDFDPAPKVDSAIMRLDILPTPLVEVDLQRNFFTVVNAGFSEKRKKLGNVLGKFFGIESQKLLGDLDANRRAETLSIEEWVNITKNFKNAEI